MKTDADRQRANISKARRVLVWERTGGKCWWCWRPLRHPTLGDRRHRPMTVDHKVPIDRGGTNDVENLVPSCATCNEHHGNCVVAPGEPIPWLSRRVARR